MASKKISQLTNATTPLTGNEEVPVVQAGVTVKTTAQDIADLAGTSTSLQEVTDVGNTTTNTINANSPTPSNTNFVGVQVFDSDVNFHQIKPTSFVLDAEEGSTTLSYINPVGADFVLNIPAANGTLATVEDLTYKQVKVPLSSAQILTLGSSPVTLVPAQGAGKVIIPVSVVMNYNFITSAYSTSTDVLILSPSSPTSITRTGILGFGADACTFDVPINSGASNPLTGNEPLLIQTSGVNPTGGNSTLDVYVAYYVITL